MTHFHHRGSLATASELQKNLPGIDHTAARWPKGHIDSFLLTGHMTRWFLRRDSYTLKDSSIRKLGFCSPLRRLERLRCGSHPDIRWGRRVSG